MRISKIFPLIILVAGCVSNPTVQPASEPSGNGSTASSTKTAPAGLSAEQNPTISPLQATTPSPASFSSGILTLTIFSPLDQAVVSQSSVEIQGEVSTDAVLTINDDIYVLPPGIFTEMVALEQGPNAIQIVASDQSGNEIDQILTVIYQP